MLSLSVAQRLELKGRAHAIKPVVLVGSAGLTPAVLEEIERSLKSHDLLKIRVMSNEREARQAMLQAICEAVHAAPVQHIGKMLVIWRPLEKPIAQKPKRKPRKALTRKQSTGR